ncbi:HAD hydrolase family protein [Chloroflexota bacterium]
MTAPPVYRDNNTMAELYTHITSEVARCIALLMTDVDGTMLEDGIMPPQAVVNAVRSLQNAGITVGLVSGRHMPVLESMARDMDIRGPLIAENGGLAKISVGGDLLPLGFSRKPALAAYAKLKLAYGKRVRGRKDNEQRLIDFVFYADNLSAEDINRYLESDVQMLDSGYIRHLMQANVSKGETLQKIVADSRIDCTYGGGVMVVGDSTTDISLFERFDLSVLVANPNLPADQTTRLDTLCRYRSTLPFADGFVQVTRHIVKMRESAL